MVQDKPWNEVWRSLSLDQTELNIFSKYSRLNQIWENDPHPIDWIDNLNLSKIEPLWSLMTKREKLHKDKVE
jgi:GH43 family beta-xylosidase